MTPPPSSRTPAPALRTSSSGPARTASISPRRPGSCRPVSTSRPSCPRQAGRRRSMPCIERSRCPAGFELRPDDDVLAFAGRLMWTKGIQHAVAALPLIARRRPSVRLLVAGDGPARAPLERLVAHLSEGDAAGARELALAEQELRTLPEFGPVARRSCRPRTVGPVGRLHVAFLGHLTPAQLARVFAAADVSLAPSIFPESLGLVTMEALSAGALPIASYHSGLMSVLDVVADSLADPAFRTLPPGASLTSGDRPRGGRHPRALPHRRPGVPHSSPRPLRAALPHVGEGGPPVSRACRRETARSLPVTAMLTARFGTARRLLCPHS